MVLLRIIFVEESECRTKSVTKRKGVLQKWIYISNIYGDMLASPNGLFGFLPTFYPQKASILTEVVGEDKKTLTVFQLSLKIL